MNKQLSGVLDFINPTIDEIGRTKDMEIPTKCIITNEVLDAIMLKAFKAGTEESMAAAIYLRDHRDDLLDNIKTEAQNTPRPSSRPAPIPRRVVDIDADAMRDILNIFIPEELLKEAKRRKNINNGVAEDSGDGPSDPPANGNNRERCHMCKI